MKDTDLKKIVRQLKDDTNYYGNMGKQFLSNSDIQHLLYNPQDFHKSIDDDKNLIMGRYFHQSFLEKDKAKDFPILDTSSRRTKEYKEYIQNNDVPFVMLSSEAKEVDNMYASMNSNLKFYDLINAENNQTEVPMVKDILQSGLFWKGKADIIHDDYVIDLKTTSSLKDFPRSVRSFNYDSQAFIYRELFGKDMLFLVVDKKTYQLGLFPCSEALYERGHHKVQKAEEQYQKFFGDNATEDVQNYFHYEILY